MKASLIWWGDPAVTAAFQRRIEAFLDEHVARPQLSGDADGGDIWRRAQSGAASAAASFVEHALLALADVAAASNPKNHLTSLAPD